MSKIDSKVTRRKFMLVGSAAAAVPLVADLTSAKAMAAATTQSAAASAPLTQPKGTKIYYITRGCVGCQTCRTFCPVKAIHFGDGANEIDQNKCIHCGTCYNECPCCVITETVN
jgi:ferredoxin